MSDVKVASDPQAAVVGRTISRLARILELAVSSVDLSPAQYRLLAHLDGSPSNGRALADRLLVTPPTLTAVVDGLVARDYVKRSDDAHDRRRVAHTLTDEGVRALAAAHVAVGEELDLVLGFADTDGQARALDGFEVWDEALTLYMLWKIANR